MMNEKTLLEIIRVLQRESLSWNVPVVTLIALQERNPFKVLLSTILSLRTKDEVTIEASRRLFLLLHKPSDIFSVSETQIQEAIYPVGFYKRKSKVLSQICRRLVEEFDSRVPDDLDVLLSFDGVGRKTANLVLSEGYQIPAMCVDTHVHRISNRFGFIETKTPEQSEMALRKKLSKEYWNSYNSLLVAFGQKICRPISPHCSSCPVAGLCLRVGVEKNR